MNQRRRRIQRWRARRKFNKWQRDLWLIQTGQKQRESVEVDLAKLMGLPSEELENPGSSYAAIASRGPGPGMNYIDATTLEYVRYNPSARCEATYPNEGGCRRPSVGRLHGVPLCEVHRQREAERCRE